LEFRDIDQIFIYQPPKPNNNKRLTQNMATETKIPLNPKGKSIPLERYAGKWVAFIEEKVVAFANSLEELEKKIKKIKPKKEPVYFLVPRKDEGPYVL